MNNNFEKIKTYISNIKKYQIKKEESILINYKLLNEDINDINKDLISHLIKDKLCKELFFDKVKDVYIFNQNKFIEVIFNTNEYMENSYTKYENKVGLFLKDKDTVQLNFPYKDCVLIGGMDKEDDKVNLEVFYNETLEKDKINKLFEPKVFHNINKFSYSKDLAENDKLDNPNNIQVDTDISEINFNQDKIKDNLLIKGNNLLGLHSLARRLNGSIDVIYIDPPYYFDDTENDSFAYNSNFKLSTWLTFMKNRLDIAKELLSDEGVIFISMNEQGSSHLKILCDEIFGHKNFIEKFNWEQTQHFGRQKKNSYVNSENIITYTKKKYIGENMREVLIEYKKTDFEDAPLYNKSNPEKNITFPKGKVKFNIKDGVYQKTTNPAYSLLNNVIVENGWNKNDFTLSFKGRWQQKTINEEIKKGTIFWVKSEGFAIRAIYGEGKEFNESPRKIIFTNSSNELSTKILNKKKVGTTEEGTSMLKKLGFNENDFPYPKPVSLIEYLISLTQNSNATVLDFFAGSGTTAHSVLSLNNEDGGNRKFILLEQMNYIEDITSERIKRAMIKEGYEDSFIYMEMKESEVKELKNNIKSSQSKEELISLINDNFNNGFFINIDNKEQLLLKIEEIYSKSTKKSNPLNDSIKLVIEKHMDNNIDYVSYEDIKGINIKENELKLNKSFYEGK